MKNFCFIFTICSLFTSGYSQVQNGLVREQNSGKIPIGGVQIIFNDAIPTTSDDSGSFRLTFKGKNPGDLIFYNEIKKSGYELVNGKDLEVLKISSNNSLIEDIILAKAGVLEAAKKEYYNISDKALMAGFTKEKKELQEQLQQAKISQNKYLERLNALQEQYDNQKQTLDPFAEKFARVNFDDVEPLYREAIEFFKAGKISETQKKMEEANLIGRADIRLKERKRIQGAKEEINQQEIDNEKGIRQDILSMQLLVQTYLLEFKYEKAETIYDQLFLLDSTDLAILQESADFYKQIHRYTKALRLYNIIIADPQVEALDKAAANSRVGEIYTILGNLVEALQAFRDCFFTYQLLILANPDNLFYKYNLAVSYEKIGNMHKSLSTLDEALPYFKDETTLFEELYETYPENVKFKSGLAISYSKLGDTYTSLGNLDKALTFFKKSLRVDKELCEAYPQNEEFKYELSISFSRLGETFTLLKDLDLALFSFKESFRLAEELFDTYPQNVEFKSHLAISYEKLGELYYSLDSLDKALTYLENYILIEKELYEEYPQNVEFKNGLVISNSWLGNVHTSLQNFPTALTFYRESYNVINELYEVHPQNVEYKNELAISCGKLGEIYAYLSSLDIAQTFFEKDLQLTKELYEAYPQNMGFKSNLANIYFNLALFYRNYKNDTKNARTYYQEAKKLYSQLADDFPTYPEFAHQLEIVKKRLKGL